MIAREELERLLAKFAGLRIGLLGDLFLDRYLEIDAGRREQSIETGLEAYQVTAVRNAPGALGTVMNNLAALGVGQLVPVTVLGDDGHADDLMRSVARLPAAVETRFIVRRSERLTPTYTKPLRREAAGTWTELNRLDVRSREPLSAAAQQDIESHVEQAYPKCDGWIVLDQIPETDCGVVNRRVRELLDRLAARYPTKPLLIDSRCHLGDFQCGSLKGNRAEFLAAVGAPPEAEASVVEAAATELARRTGRTSYCTIGDAGILVSPASGQPQRVPGFPAPGPVDIVGAGDSATSGIITALLSGAEERTAALLGNLVASITVQQIGTTGVASPAQVLERWQQLQ